MAVGAEPLGGSLDLTSDYFVRGISRSDDDPALQLDVHYLASSGLLAGMFASNTQIDPHERRDVELSPFLGYLAPLGPDWQVKLIASRYLFPWNAAGSSYDYDELDADFVCRSGEQSSRHRGRRARCAAAALEGLLAALPRRGRRGAEGCGARTARCWRRSNPPASRRVDPHPGRLPASTRARPCRPSWALRAAPPRVARKMPRRAWHANATEEPIAGVPVPDPGPRPGSRAASAQTPLEHDELEITAQRHPEASILIRKGSRLTGEPITPPLIPRDERVADIQHLHLDLERSTIHRPLLTSRQNLAAQSSVLKTRVHRQRAEVPLVRAQRFHPNAGAQTAFGIIQHEKEPSRAARQLREKILRARTVALDELCLAVPACVGPHAPVAHVHQPSDRRYIGGVRLS